MADSETIADEFETILQRVMKDADAISPAPEEYFLLGDRTDDRYWVLGFRFKTKAALREALENGVCYQAYECVLDSIARSQQLEPLKSYIVFDFGEAPATTDSQQRLHQKYIDQLGALNRERESGPFLTCSLCGHDVNAHLMIGPPEGEDAVPVKGWMICKDKNCTCFRTWSFAP